MSDWYDFRTYIFVVSSSESTPYSFLIEDFTLAMKVPSGRPKATARLPFSCLNVMAEGCGFLDEKKKVTLHTGPKKYSMEKVNPSEKPKSMSAWIINQFCPRGKACCYYCFVRNRVYCVKSLLGIWFFYGLCYATRPVLHTN